MVLDGDIELVVAGMFVEMAHGWVLSAVGATHWLASLATARTSTFWLTVSGDASGPYWAGHTRAWVSCICMEQ